MFAMVTEIRGNETK